MSRRNPKSDRAHGLHRRITRRQFLDGVAVGAAALPTGPARGRAALPADDPYPPACTGLRGSHAGSFEVAHALKGGQPWRTLGTPVDTGEACDLVVVGGGLSGLAAGHCFGRATGGRVLVLDNHDDLGGHARRNEFTVGDRTLISYGGSWAVDSPAPYSATAQALRVSLGVRTSRWKQVHNAARYGALGLGNGIFCDRETFGAGRLLADPVSFWLEGGETPCERARRPFGRIAIANADAGAYAYADGAIDQAHRTVRELLG